MAGERILVIDDDPAILDVVAVALGLDGFDVITARDGTGGLERAASARPDLVILDVAMPELDGAEVCRRLRADPRTAHLPVVMLTARSSSQQVVDGLGAGADDYVTKPFDPEVLSARVQAVLRRATELRDQSPLTGLPGNRRIEQEIDRRVGHPVAIAYADLNDFKTYNDTYGFLQGDRALQATSWLLREVLSTCGGEDPFLGHVGGDDFIIVCRPEDVHLVCEMATTRFDALAPTLCPAHTAGHGSVEQADRDGGTRPFPLLSLSIGVASTGEDRLVDARELIDCATSMKRQLKAARSDGSDFAVRVLSPRG